MILPRASTHTKIWPCSAHMATPSKHDGSICAAAAMRPVAAVTVATCFFHPRDAVLAQVVAMALCLSVCLSVCQSEVGVLSKRLNESDWFWHGSFLRPILYTLCYKEVQVLPKIRVLSSETFLSPNSGLRKFRHGKSIALSTTLVDSRAC